MDFVRRLRHSKLFIFGVYLILLSANSQETGDESNMNYAAPVIDSQRHHKIFYEWRETGSLGIKVFATDADQTHPNNAIFFFIENDEGIFSVNENTGEVFLARSLYDSTSVDSYEIIIKARDGGTPPLESRGSVIITVTIIRNKYAPHFVQKEYETIMNPDHNRKEPLIRPSFSDDDLKRDDDAHVLPYPKLIVFIVGDQYSDLFEIRDKHNGFIYIREDADLSLYSQRHFEIKIMVSDATPLPKNSTADVKITINRYFIVEQSSDMGGKLASEEKTFYKSCFLKYKSQTLDEDGNVVSQTDSDNKC